MFIAAVLVITVFGTTIFGITLFITNSVYNYFNYHHQPLQLKALTAWYISANLSHSCIHSVC